MRRRLAGLLALQMALVLLASSYAIGCRRAEPRLSTYAYGASGKLEAHVGQAYTWVVIVAEPGEDGDARITKVTAEAVSHGLDVRFAAVRPDEDRTATLEGFPGDPRDRLGPVLRPVRGLRLAAVQPQVTRIYVTLRADRPGRFATKVRVHWRDGVFGGSALVGDALYLEVRHTEPYVPNADQLRCNQLLNGYLGRYGFPPGC